MNNDERQNPKQAMDSGENYSKLVILEGPDGSGKSYLARQLFKTCQEQKYSFRYTHNGRYGSKEEAYQAFNYQIDRESHLYSLDENVNRKAISVIDRTFLSEKIYSAVMRGQDLTENDELFNSIVEKTFKLPILFIFCMLEYEANRGNWYSRISLEYVKDEQRFRSIYELYESFFSIFKEDYEDKIALYNYQTTNTSYFFKRIFS